MFVVVGSGLSVNKLVPGGSKALFTMSGRQWDVLMIEALVG
jgi:hypothetical protein